MNIWRKIVIGRGNRIASMKAYDGSMLSVFRKNIEVEGETRMIDVVKTLS